ncbi:hypothetical protein ACSBR2_014488 [Camellia fascicularis]
MKKGNEKGSVLQFAPFQSAVDEEFWHRLSSLKLNLFGIDDSPISITVEIARKVFVWVSMHLVYILNYQILSLRAESLPPEPCVQSSITRSRGDRNKCSVPGILYNTNTLEGFQALDKQSLLKAEARKIWEDIHSGKAEEDSTILSKFLLISFADLKKWTFHYWFAFPSLSLDPPATLVDLRPASQCLSLEEVRQMLNRYQQRVMSGVAQAQQQVKCLELLMLIPYLSADCFVCTLCGEPKAYEIAMDVPFFWVCFDTNSHATIKHLKDWDSCQHDSHKF